MQTAQTPRFAPTNADRDPVGLAVEQHVRDLAHASKEIFCLSSNAHGGVTGVFGGVKAQGESHDIALLRLASMLLEDPRYMPRLTCSLRSVTGLGPEGIGQSRPTFS